MEIKLNQLKNIFVAYRDSTNRDFSEPPIKNKFNESLGSHPLLSIKWIYIRYELDERDDMNLKMKQGDSEHEWDVCKMDESFFSFTYKDEKDFIDRFEESLKQKLEKQELEEYYKKHPYSFPPPDHDAEVSMD
ncbi:hypothetical protein ES705_14711 [subsurface metagenome]